MTDVWSGNMDKDFRISSAWISPLYIDLNDKEQVVVDIYGEM
jgi:hypothetical protein